MLGQRAQRAWAELKESREMVLEIEEEGLKQAHSEAERRYSLIIDKLRRRTSREVSI